MSAEYFRELLSNPDQATLPAASILYTIDAAKGQYLPVQQQGFKQSVPSGIKLDVNPTTGIDAPAEERHAKLATAK